LQELTLISNRSMASYFDEHNCQPLATGETPDHMMHIARLLVDTGHWNDDEFSALFNDRAPPPASKKFLEEEVPDKTIREEADEFECPVCLKRCEQDDVYNELPCSHRFHKECVGRWLGKTNSCPLCRHELPTDDPAYEEMKRQKNRAKQRKDDIENLHNSMFG